jgi:hypothetical protein
VGEQRKPRFEVGDWVKLKDEIVSQEAAFRLSRNVFFNPKMLEWKNRFMKIALVMPTINSGAFYHVKENKWVWEEAWLEKVK